MIAAPSSSSSPTRARAIEEEAKAAARAVEDDLFKGFRRFERELMLQYMRMALANAEGETTPDAERRPIAP